MALKTLAGSSGSITNMLKDRATPFHGGYRIEHASEQPKKASLFVFVYPHSYRGTQYIIRKGLTKKVILSLWVEGVR